MLLHPIGSDNGTFGFFVSVPNRTINKPTYSTIFFFFNLVVLRNIEQANPTVFEILNKILKNHSGQVHPVCRFVRIT